ncbi:hypothetical protein BSL78_04211, partial [Apostichopus japonicus]
MAQVVEDEDHEAHCPVCSVEELCTSFIEHYTALTELDILRINTALQVTILNLALKETLEENSVIILGTLSNPSESCCDFCEENTYQPKFNNCKCCILCTNCTELGREELQACNITNDAKCGNISASVAPVEEAGGVTTEATVISETTTVSTGSGKEDASDLPPQSTCPE